MSSLSGTGAVVTGAARGIGFAIADALAQAGASVVVSDVDARAAEDAAEALRHRGADVYAQACDVTSEDDVRRLVRDAM